jgi:hypothetical protein
MLHKSASKLIAMADIPPYWRVACRWYAEGRDVQLAGKLMTPWSHGTGTAASVGRTKYIESQQCPKLQGLEGNLMVSKLGLILNKVSLPDPHECQRETAILNIPFYWDCSFMSRWPAPSVQTSAQHVGDAGVALLRADVSEERWFLQEPHPAQHSSNELLSHIQTNKLRGT